MCSTHNKVKFAVTERFIRALKNKIFKYVSSLSKNVYIGKLDDIANKYNTTYHRTTKIKATDVNSGTYIEFDKEIIRNVLNLKLVIM